jgi:hypothetical protein
MPFCRRAFSLRDLHRRGCETVFEGEEYSGEALNGNSMKPNQLNGKRWLAAILLPMLSDGVGFLYGAAPAP